MARARLFTKPRPPIVRRPHEVAAERVFEVRFHWGRWPGALFLAGIMTVLMAYGAWFAWRVWQEAESDGPMIVAQVMGMAAFLSGALAWAIAVFGLRAQHRGHVLRADAAGVSVAGLTMIIPWSNILSVEADRDFAGISRDALWIRLQAEAPGNPVPSNSFLTWLRGRAPCVDVTRNLVLVRPFFGRTTPRTAAEGICRAGALHGWKPAARVQAPGLLSELRA